MIVASATDIVVVTLLVESGVLVLALAAILVHIGWRAFDDPRRQDRVQVARRAMAGALAGGTQPAADTLRALRPLRRGERLELLAGYAAVAGGDGPQALASLAEQSGITHQAIARARSRRWTARLAGARALTTIGAGAEVMPALLDDPHPAVRAQAAEWAGTQGDDAVIARLVAHLSDRAPAARFSIQDAVVRLGARATPAVARQLDVVDEGPLAISLLEVAEAVGDPVACRAASRFVHAADPRARELACLAAARLGDSDTMDDLQEALADPDEGVRAAAARSLGAAGHWPAAGKLRRALRDPGWEVRRAAALALHALGAPGELMLRQALNDEDRFARDMARLVLELEGQD
jgi:HEAT repeat protein